MNLHQIVNYPFIDTYNANEILLLFTISIGTEGIMTTHTRFKYSSIFAVALLTAFSAQALAEETVTAAVDSECRNCHNYGQSVS